MLNIREILFSVFFVIEALLLFFCLLRACIGPEYADRLVAINMMGAMINVIICALAVFLKQGYLVDIALIYSMLSFLAVVVITKIYIGAYTANKSDSNKTEEKEN